MSPEAEVIREQQGEPRAATPEERRLAVNRHAQALEPHREDWQVERRAIPRLSVAATGNGAPTLWNTLRLVMTA